jgi:hypothetical protein
MREITQISCDKLAEAEDLLGEDGGNLPGPVISLNTPQSSTSLMQAEMCMVSS